MPIDRSKQKGSVDHDASANTQKPKETERNSPVLVESPAALFSQMFSPDGLKTSDAMGSLNVTSDTNNNYGRSLDDGDWLQNFLLVRLCTRNVMVRI